MLKSSVRDRILGLLVDGRFHSGEELGAGAGVTRAAVWKVIRKLVNEGVEIDAVRGRGYRLRSPYEPLSTEAIVTQLRLKGREVIPSIQCFDTIGSTNTFLLQAADAGTGQGAVCIAEHQTSGRGRRGREWISAPGGNIYLSMLWHFREGPSTLSGLSLAVGVMALRALGQSGINDVGLKWPNDLVAAGHKLGGILIEVAGESSGPCYAVIGFGLNVTLTESAGMTIDQPWVSLGDISPSPVSRNQLIANLVREIHDGLEEFSASGLEPFRGDWARYDCLAGKTVEVTSNSGVVTGTAVGIDESGHILIATETGIVRFGSGEVTVRGA